MAIGFKGWNWNAWLKANKGNLRLIISAVLGIVTTTVGSLPTPYALALGGLVTAGSKMILDTVDYYFSK